MLRQSDIGYFSWCFLFKVFDCPLEVVQCKLIIRLKAHSFLASPDCLLEIAKAIVSCATIEICDSIIRFQTHRLTCCVYAFLEVIHLIIGDRQIYPAFGSWRCLDNIGGPAEIFMRFIELAEV